MKDYSNLRSLAPAVNAVLMAVFLFAFIAQGQDAAPFNRNASPLPAPTSPIMDYANVIDAETEERIESKLIAFRDSSNPTVELGVAVVETTGDIPIFDYSLAVARGWKIGTAKDDNPAALLLVAINDRKYFTQVDYDLEDELPDGIVGSLQRQFLVPEFKKGNYGKGIEDTIDAYIETIRAKQTGEANPFAADEGDSDAVSTGVDKEDLTCCVIGVLIFGVFIFMTVMRASRNGGGRGGRKGRDYASAAGEVAINVVGGIILGALSGGGSSSGDSGGSSGGDWGGFSGGGDFGGGGAGGSW